MTAMSATKTSENGASSRWTFGTIRRERPPHQGFDTKRFSSLLPASAPATRNVVFFADRPGHTRAKPFERRLGILASSTRRVLVSTNTFSASGPGSAPGSGACEVVFTPAAISRATRSRVTRLVRELTHRRREHRANFRDALQLFERRIKNAIDGAEVSYASVAAAFSPRAGYRAHRPAATGRCSCCVPICSMTLRPTLPACAGALSPIAGRAV